MRGRVCCSPGLSWACHSPSVFCTGKLLESLIALALDPKRAPRNGMLGIDRRSTGRVGVFEIAARAWNGVARAAVVLETVYKVRMKVCSEGNRIKGDFGR